MTGKTKYTIDMPQHGKDSGEADNVAVLSSDKDTPDMVQVRYSGSPPSGVAFCAALLGVISRQWGIPMMQLLQAVVDISLAGGHEQPLAYGNKIMLGENVILGPDTPVN